MKKCKKCNKFKEDCFFKKGYECKSCESIRKKEWTKNNKDRIKLQQQEYYKENRERIILREKKFRKDNPEIKKQRDKEYYEKNKKQITKKNIEYVEKNKEKTREYKKQWAIENSDKLKIKRKLYYQKNKELLKEKNKERMRIDPVYALSVSLRKSVLKSFINRSFNKGSKTQEILGCTFEEFKIYIESKFEPWMNWENRGKYNGELSYGWDLDHIIPICSATSEGEVISLNHFTNLQPLCSHINRNIKKGRG